MRARAVPCYFSPGGGGTVTVGTETVVVTRGVETVTDGALTAGTVGTPVTTPPTVVAAAEGTVVDGLDPALDPASAADLAAGAAAAADVAVPEGRSFVGALFNRRCRVAAGLAWWNKATSARRLAAFASARTGCSESGAKARTRSPTDGEGVGSG